MHRTCRAGHRQKLEDCAEIMHFPISFGNNLEDDYQKSFKYRLVKRVKLSNPGGLL